MHSTARTPPSAQNCTAQQGLSAAPKHSTHAASNYSLKRRHRLVLWQKTAWLSAAWLSGLEVYSTPTMPLKTRLNVNHKLAGQAGSSPMQEAAQCRMCMPAAMHGAAPLVLLRHSLICWACMPITQLFIDPMLCSCLPSVLPRQRYGRALHLHQGLLALRQTYIQAAALELHSSNRHQC